MRFKVNIKEPHISGENMPEAESSAPQDAYISRGQPNSFLEFLEQIQRSLSESGMMDEGLMVMVNVNPQTGQMLMTLARAPEPVNPNPHQPNMAQMGSALTQYKKEQEDLMNSLKTSIQKVQRNRQAYQSFSQYSRRHSLAQQRLHLLEELVKQPQEKIINEKPRSMSQDTMDEHWEGEKVESCTSLEEVSERLPQTPRSKYEQKIGKGY